MLLLYPIAKDDRTEDATEPALVSAFERSVANDGPETHDASTLPSSCKTGGKVPVGTVAPAAQSPLDTGSFFIIKREGSFAEPSSVQREARWNVARFARGVLPANQHICISDTGVLMADMNEHPSSVQRLGAAGEMEDTANSGDAIRIDTPTGVSSCKGVGAADSRWISFRKRPGSTFEEAGDVARPDSRLGDFVQ
jgi:hypothetical protein